ncbi:hypothetical protein [Cyanobium sp. LEGE 06113]|uniref:hypothetical protein n=1 Tax=Cyanobium sp. LEGE 06113 TaxID=1297573 RepID=UPI00187E262C|nr:hypothetical protein [Cyanobium sp. LEGE 06113]MBE9152601.1 hypothetical protein [Cyanobium sp. LEGE 06113]MBE9153194.1 hypothetical protein [Cyanobium sp. LEGE 06113]
MKIITVISYPRTGSSLLIRKIGQFRVTALLEIFHVNPAIATRHLQRDRALRACSEFIQGYSREVYRHDPLALIDAISELKPNSEALVFKVFPAHLSAEALERVVARSDALVIHTRNRLHSFLSDVIATRLGSWGGMQTADQHVVFSADSFQSYSAHIHDFLSLSLKLAIDHKTSILFSDYETIIEPSCCADFVEAMLTTLLGHRPKTMAVNTSTGLPVRQDSRILATQKVANPDELAAFLAQHSLQMLDSGIVDIAFSDYSLLGIATA